MALRALPATLGMVPRLLAAGRRGAALGLLAHKLFRWLAPAAATIWLVSAGVLAFRPASPYRVASIGLLTIGGVAVAIGLLTPRTRGAVSSLLLAQVAFGLALLDAIRGRRARTWTRTAG